MGNRSVVLLHGAGVGPWVWERVHTALQVPSLAADVRGTDPDASPDACADALMRQVDAFTSGEVVLVAHSKTGVLIPGLANRLGSRLAHVVYISTIIPAAGQSFLSTIGFPMGWVMRVAFWLNPRGLRPSDSMIRSGLCNDLDESDAARVIKGYTPEFPGLFATPVAGPARVPSTYVRLGRDGSVAPAVQDKMIARLQAPEVVELDAGHLAMLSKPDDIARVINLAASA